MTYLAQVAVHQEERFGPVNLRAWWERDDDGRMILHALLTNLPALEAHLLPACVRERFGIWRPTRAVVDAQTEGSMLDRAVAAQLATAAGAAMGMALPPDALNNLMLLLHAAMVRARPTLAQQVLVVCPSGMATTQLLVARLALPPARDSGA